MMKKSLISPSCFCIGWWLFSLLGSPHEVRDPEQELIHHSTQADQDPDIENGDHHQHELAVPQLVLHASPLLEFVAIRDVDEVLAARMLLLLDQPGGEEVGKKQQK